MYPVPVSLNILMLSHKGLWLYILKLHYFIQRCGINQTLYTVECHCCPLGQIILTYACFCFCSSICKQWFWSIITRTVYYWQFIIHIRGTASLSELEGHCSGPYTQPVCLSTAMIIKLGGSLPSAVIWIVSGKWASSTLDQELGKSKKILKKIGKPVACVVFC